MNPFWGLIAFSIPMLVFLPFLGRGSFQGAKDLEPEGLKKDSESPCK